MINKLTIGAAVIGAVGAVVLIKFVPQVRGFLKI